MNDLIGSIIVIKQLKVNKKIDKNFITTLLSFTFYLRLRFFISITTKMPNNNIFITADVKIKNYFQNVFLLR